ncbi:MAG: solute:Na+ symporter, family [Pseudomonadota bacterium]|nr:solute:Na+ symporter, family [Pseudomonadota bacterium]
MYLLSLTNLDYALITIFLGINFIIAYLFRRKNQSSEAFLFAPTKVDRISSFIGNFGLVEIVLAGIGGAYFGFNTIYYIILAIVLQLLGQKLLTRRYRLSNVVGLNDYLAVKFNRYFAIIVASLNVVLLILCLSLAVAVAFKSLQAVMGWGFINNIMGLLGLTIILILIGGRAAILYNGMLAALFILAVFVISIVVAVWHLGGVDAVIYNLNNLALAKNLPAKYYILPTIPTIDKQMLLIIGAIMVGVAGINWLNFNLLSNSVPNCAPRQNQLSTGFAKLLSIIGVIIILVLPGIIAIATPHTGSTIAGKEIVTIMAQLPDGQTGYVVKAVDSNGKGGGIHKYGSSSPGIVPPLLNPKTGMLEANKYNYAIASMVMVRHYLSDMGSFWVILLIVAGFMLNIGRYMLQLGQITVNNVLLPLNLITKYGKIGELWSLQVSIVAYTGVILVLAYFMFLHYDLILFVKLFAAVMVVPLLFMLGIMCYEKK